MSQSASGTSKDLAKYKSVFIQRIEKESMGNKAEITQRMIQSDALKIMDYHHALVNAIDNEDVQEQKRLQRKLGAFQCVYNCA